MSKKEFRKRKPKILVKKPIAKKSQKQLNCKLSTTTLIEGDKISFPKKGQTVTVSYEGTDEESIVFDKSSSFKFKLGVG
jgi:FKBP-type peptidyl-prolyl cis-trans isomerase